MATIDEGCCETEICRKLSCTSKLAKQIINVGDSPRAIMQYMPFYSWKSEVPVEGNLTNVDGVSSREHLYNREYLDKKCPRAVATKPPVQAENEQNLQADELNQETSITEPPTYKNTVTLHECEYNGSDNCNPQWVSLWQKMDMTESYVVQRDLVDVDETALEVLSFANCLQSFVVKKQTMSSCQKPSCSAISPKGNVLMPITQNSERSIVMQELLEYGNVSDDVFTKDTLEMRIEKLHCHCFSRTLENHGSVGVDMKGINEVLRTILCMNSLSTHLMEIKLLPVSRNLKFHTSSTPMRKTLLPVTGDRILCTEKVHLKHVNCFDEERVIYHELPINFPLAHFYATGYIQEMAAMNSLTEECLTKEHEGIALSPDDKIPIDKDIINNLMRKRTSLIGVDHHFVSAGIYICVEDLDDLKKWSNSLLDVIFSLKHHEDEMDNKGRLKDQVNCELEGRPKTLTESIVNYAKSRIEHNYEETRFILPEQEQYNYINGSWGKNGTTIIVEEDEESDYHFYQGFEDVLEANKDINAGGLVQMFPVPLDSITDTGDENNQKDAKITDSSNMCYDSMYKSYKAWCRHMTISNDPWELAYPDDEDDYPVRTNDLHDIGEEELFSQIDSNCNIVDCWSMSDVYKSSHPVISGKETEAPRRVYLFQEPDGTTSINVIEGSATSEGGQGFSSSFLVSCLSLVAFMQEMKEKVHLDGEVRVPEMKSQSKGTLEKTFRPCMTMKDIALKVVAWLLMALVVNAAATSFANYTSKSLNNELKNILCDEASKLLRKADAPLKDDVKKVQKLWSPLAWRIQRENPKRDFLRDVLNVPDCIQPPQQIIAVYPLFEQRGYEDEFRRLASFGRCPEQKWYPAVPLAENGFYFEPESSVVCNFCKSKSHTWQRGWNPKMKHEPDCPFLNGNDCGNIPMEPSRENGKYQTAVQSALDELQVPQLQNKNQVLLRNSKRSVETFKNPQLPEYQMESLSIGQGQGQQEHDAMEDQPQPSTSNSSQQQQEGAGGLRYFVHSYDERGRPISTSQKMEFNSKEEKANTSMKRETDRLKSFANVWKKRDVISPEELAKSGFYYAGTGDRVRCAFCNGVLRNWAVGDHAAAEHRRHYPTCPFVLNLDVGNIPYSPDLSNLHTPTAATTNHTEQKRPAARTPGQQSAQSSAASFGAAITPSAVPGTILIPKHSNFSTVESRMLTYDNWPTSNVQRPKQLAEAGFFYTGASDNVRCFHCDGGLRNWLDSDMPWVEHAKWFPRCGFLQRVKGVEFVLEETRKHNQQNFTTAVAQNRGSTGMTTTPAATQGVGIVERPATGGVRRVEAREVRARFDTDRVKMVLDMGYKEAVVKYVILQRLRYTGDDFSSTQEMLESVLAEEPNLEEKGIAYYENILQQEFGRPMTIVYPQVPQLTGPGGKLDKTAVPSPAPPMTQTTSASLEIPGDEKSLVEENRQLKEQTTCKICMDNEVSMVFVPCGHLVACADCAPNLRQCPICRRAITGTIRTFLS